MPDRVQLRSMSRDQSGDLVIRGTAIAEVPGARGQGDDGGRSLRTGVGRGAGLRAGHDVGHVDVRADAHEREADTVATQVLEGPGPRPEARPRGVRPDGLDTDTRAFFEPRFGHDFAAVRVHSGPDAAAAAARRRAHAFTVGDDITFARGAYAPHTRAGRALLAHELAHVVQQSDRRGSDGLASRMTRTSGRPAQCKLVATGDAAGFAALASSIIAVQFTVTIGTGGEVSIVSSDVQGPPTREAQELTARLRTIIADPATTTVEFIHGRTSTRPADASVLIGAYATAQLDLDDIGAFGSGAGISSATTLGHELVEQYRRQVHGEAYGPAHAAGEGVEAAMTGATRGTHTVRPVSPGIVEITVPYTYPGGRIVDVTMTIANGNVTAVRRSERRVP